MQGFERDGGQGRGRRHLAAGADDIAQAHIGARHRLPARIIGCRREGSDHVRHPRNHGPARLFLQRAHVIGHLPDVLRRGGLGVGRHWRAVNPGEHPPGNHLGIAARAIVPPLRQIRRTDRHPPVIRQRGCRGAVAASLDAMTRGAAEFLIHLLADDRIGAHATGVRPYGERLRRIVGEVGREGFEVRHQLPPDRFIQVVPVGHAACRQALGDGPKDILIRRRAPAGGVANLEHPGGQIARPGIEPFGVPSVAAARDAVAAGALLQIRRAARRHVSRRLVGEGADIHTPEAAGTQSEEKEEMPRADTRHRVRTSLRSTRCRSRPCGRMGVF